MAHLFIFGLGYTAQRIRAGAIAHGWQVSATGRAGNLDFQDDAAVRERLATATHVLSSVPPEPRSPARPAPDRKPSDSPAPDAAATDAAPSAPLATPHTLTLHRPTPAETASARADGTIGDPVLARYGDALGGHWLGYLSSTGIYGDTGGAWVDETAPTLLAAGATGRRTLRAGAEAAWLARGAHTFRLPGIYGPGRSALDRVRDGRAHRIDLPDQVFSRVHVDDIASGVLAVLAAGRHVPPGPWNLADDWPTSQNVVIEEACRLLGQAPPPLLPLDRAGLSPMARGFYGENRRVANGKAKRLLGWRPRHPDYRSGLHAIFNDIA